MSGSIEGTCWQSPPHTEASALRSQRATDQGLLAQTTSHPNPNALQMLSSHSGVSGVGGGLSTTSTGSQGIQLQQLKLANSRFSMDQGQVDHLALGLRSMSGAQVSHGLESSKAFVHPGMTDC